VMQLSVKLNVVARVKCVLDTKCNVFRPFVVMYLDLVLNFETLSECALCVL
jgi:hypothetical protein